MGKAILISALLLAAIMSLTLLQRNHPGLDPRVRLTFERQRAVRLQELQARHWTPAPVVACAASRLKPELVETAYVIWVHRRLDLVEDADRDAAERDIDQALRGCGGDPDALASAAQGHEEDVPAQVADAMLEQGR